MIKFVTIRVQMLYQLMGWCWHEWEPWQYKKGEVYSSWRGYSLDARIRHCKLCNYRQKVTIKS